MRFLIKSVFTLATLAVLAFGAIAFLVPRDVVRDQAIALVKQQTGRDLTVEGETSFAFYPSIGVALSDVTLSNPPEMGGGAMLRMDSLTLNLKLLPLISRSVEVERFLLVRPVFDLKVDRKGRRNWDFAKKQAAAPIPLQGQSEQRAAKAAPAFVQAQASGLGGGLIQDIRLGTIRIKDGIVLYSNALDGARHRVDAVNVSLQQDDLEKPLNADGDLVWRGEKVSFQGQVGSLTALMRGGPSAVTMALSSVLANSNFKGRLVLAKAVSAEGDLTGETKSIRALADWAGSAMAPGKGLGPAKVAGHLKFQGQVLSFSKTTFTIDGMKGQGNGTVTLKGKKPYIRAAIAVDRLDLNIYTGPGKAAALPPRSFKPPPALPRSQAQPKAEPKPKEGQSLTDFIEDLNKGQKKPEVRAWSQRAIDFAGLRAVNADINFNTGAILYQQIKTGAGAVSASLKGGVLTANLNRLALYSGSGTGRITLNGARTVPALAVRLDLRNVSALPILRDAMKFKWISGRANLAVNLSGTGRTEQQIVATLNGNGSMRFSDGAIEGINIPAMVRGLKQGRFAGWKTSEREKTDFSSLTGTFSMRNGVATNTDLNLIGPLIRLTGQGTVNVPAESVDYALTPRLVASLQGQGSDQQLEGIVIPVRVYGPWARPKVKPDLKRIMENPELARDTIEKAGDLIKGLKGKKIKGKDVEQILQGVLGGGQQPQAAPAQPGQPAQAQPQPQQVNPEELLKQLFKKR